MYPALARRWWSVGRATLMSGRGPRGKGSGGALEGFSRGCRGGVEGVKWGDTAPSEAYSTAHEWIGYSNECRQSGEGQANGRGTSRTVGCIDPV
eukprot:6208681-Pyramimonas_sp.AAC.1